MEETVIYNYILLCRDITTNVGYEFTCKSASLPNALEVFRLQWLAYVGTDFTNCDTLNMTSYTTEE